MNWLLDDPVQLKGSSAAGSGLGNEAPHRPSVSSVNAQRRILPSVTLEETVCMCGRGQSDTRQSTSIEQGICIGDTACSI